jgi:hypothetical protein
LKQDVLFGIIPLINVVMPCAAALCCSSLLTQGAGMNDIENSSYTGKETRIPAWLIITGMVVITIIIVGVFAGPLNTSPDQEYPVVKQHQEGE